MSEQSMTGTISIRRAWRGECEALTRLCLRSKQSNGYDDAFMAQCAEELRVREAWIETDAFWVAASGDGRCCGCVRLTADDDDPDTGEIATFFVDPDHKRRGIGRMLMSTLLASPEAVGCHRLVLDADPFAVPFYASFGFRVVGEVPSGSIPGRMLPHMELVLQRADSEAR